MFTKEINNLSDSLPGWNIRYRPKAGGEGLEFWSILMSQSHALGHLGNGARTAKSPVFFRALIRKDDSKIEKCCPSFTSGKCRRYWEVLRGIIGFCGRTLQGVYMNTFHDRTCQGVYEEGHSLLHIAKPLDNRESQLNANRQKWIKENIN